MNSYRELEVYKKSIEFVTIIYKLTRNYPKEERFELISQLRRASVSIPSNIAEGAWRRSSKEFIQFLYIAYGSCAEIETQLIISKNLTYINEREFLEVTEKLAHITKMLNGLIQSMKRKV